MHSQKLLLGQSKWNILIRMLRSQPLTGASAIDRLAGHMAQAEQNKGEMLGDCILLIASS